VLLVHVLGGSARAKKQDLHFDMQFGAVTLFTLSVCLFLPVLTLALEYNLLDVLVM